jgi:hypothetical protein
MSIGKDVPILKMLTFALPKHQPRRKRRSTLERPTVAHLDSLGRTFLTIADNGDAGNYETRVELDIEGNQRSVMDARGRTVMTYDYDLLSVRIHQVSMDAGERWMLNDVMGNSNFIKGCYT